MAKELEEIAQEAVRYPSEERFFFHVVRRWPATRLGSQVQTSDTEGFHEYEEDKKHLDPRVVSLGPYHYGKDRLTAMQKHKITAVKQYFVNESTKRNQESGRIFYEKFKELTGVLKGFYDAKVVANMSDNFFARMLFLDGCFVLHFIENINEGGKTKLEISNYLIPLIIRDMFLMENQLPFQVLDELMKLRWGSSSSGSISLGKQNIMEFIKLKVLIPMGFYLLKYLWSGDWWIELDGVGHDRPLHLLDMLRNILLDFPPSNGAEKQSYTPRYFGSVMELKEIGIRIKKGFVKSLMHISFEENLLFPRLWLPTMYINDTTISQLLNLTALEACSDRYSGCGVTSYIHFMDSLINNDADVKKLRSKGILHHSLGSDEVVARLFNTWPGDVTNDLQLYIDISRHIYRHRRRKVKISIATWLDKYFGSPWTAVSFVGAGLLLVLTCIQTYFAAFPRR